MQETQECHTDDLNIKELQKPSEDKFDKFGQYIAEEIRTMGDPYLQSKIMTEI